MTSASRAERRQFDQFDPGLVCISVSIGTHQTPRQSDLSEGVGGREPSQISPVPRNKLGQWQHRSKVNGDATLMISSNGATMCTHGLVAMTSA